MTKNGLSRQKKRELGSIETKSHTMREVGRTMLRDCVKRQLEKLCKSMKEIVARLDLRYDRFILDNGLHTKAHPKEK